MDQTDSEQKPIVIQQDVEGDTIPEVPPAWQSTEPNVSSPESVTPAPIVVPEKPKQFTFPVKFTKQSSKVNDSVAEVPTRRNVLVLQWLTYVFWWWFVGSATWLVGVLADTFVTGAKPTDYTGSLLALPAIAMLVSLVAAVVADTLYSRHEAVHGGRAARILQTVHAVIFAVTIMTGVITILYYLLGGVFGAGYTADGRSVALITAFVSITLYALAFVRIMFPATKGWARIIIMTILAVTAGALITVALSGPAARARDARDDALLQNALTALADKIDEYAKEYKAVPSALNKLDFSEEQSEGIYHNDMAKEAVARGLVTYTPNTRPSSTTKQSSRYYSSAYRTTEATYYYRMCVTYKTVEKQRSYYSSSYLNDNLTASPSISPDVDAHDKGWKCYELRTSGSGSQYTYPALDERDYGAGADSADDTPDTSAPATGTKSSNTLKN